MARTAVKKSVRRTTTKQRTKKEAPAQVLDLLQWAEQQQEEPRTEIRFERTYTIEFKPFVREKDGQVTLAELRNLSFTEREKLWKRLNTDEDVFFGIVKPSEVSLLRHMTKAEAVARGLIREKKPHKEALFCPYCHDWNLFKKWNDYHKCTGCGVSTNDFYTRTENGLWNAK